MASRRKSRELALQMLFQWEMGQHTPEHVISTFLSPRRLEPEVEAFARDLFEGTVREIRSLDLMLAGQAENWRLDRMAAVDRNVLRLAVYELQHYPETPPAVVIDEALELARRFSTGESVEFVNGVLDGVRKRLQAEPREEGRNQKSKAKGKDSAGINRLGVGDERAVQEKSSEPS